MPKYEYEQIYHVFNRGAHKARIFVKDDDYRRLLEMLERYTKRYVVSVVAYCLMPNHYHLVVRQDPGGSISGFLKTTFNAFVQAINLLRKHSGTLFQGSAKGILVDSDEYAMQLIRYIHLNPVAAKLVRDPEDWEYSDYREWTGMKSSPLFDPAFRQGFFKTSSDYRRFVEEYKEEKDKELLGKFMFD
jgi:putative transposase